MEGLKMLEREARDAGLFVIEEVHFATAQQAFAKLAVRATKKLRCDTAPERRERTRGRTERAVARPRRDN